jgi:hypothetical protein
MTLGRTRNPVFSSAGGIHFSMSTRQHQLIDCVVGKTSLEYLAGRALQGDEMVVIFALHRRHFERMASALYDMPT